MAKQTVEPLKDRKDIKIIEKYLLKVNRRDYAIWILGLNSGLRVSDIVALNVEDVKDKIHISIVEKKTQKTKMFCINNKLKKVLQDFTKDRKFNEPLFLGKQGKRLNRKEVYRFIKKACEVNNIKIHAGTHTMRKTFGYHHYKKFKDVAMLQKIFNHSHPQITLRYIGIEQDEIDMSYKNFEL